MDSRLACLLVVATFASAAVATDVEQCSGMSIENLSELATLTPCKRLPCRLKKGTSPKIALAFTPDEDLHDLTNIVSADVFGVSLPFPGVDGSSVCHKIFLADSPDTRVPCPLKAGTKYIYKDTFPVHSFYPSLSTKIHWALRGPKKDVTCFEVNVRIS